MKELIKQLADEQRELKSQRKTGTLPELELSYFGGVIWDKVPQKIKDAWRAASQVQQNKVRITAALNLYHELRGSDYRHGIPDDPLYWGYDRILQELREQFATETVE